MRCIDVQAQFSEIYDGVAERQAVLAKHLINCPVCAAEYESYSQLLNDVKFLPEPELPEGFHDTIMSKISAIAPPSDHAIDEIIQGLNRRKNRVPQRRRNTTFARWAGVAAACLLMVSLWAANSFELPMRRDMFVTYDMVMPQAADEVAMEPIADAAPGMEVDEYYGGESRTKLRGGYEYDYSHNVFWDLDAADDDMIWDDDFEGAIAESVAPDTPVQQIAPQTEAEDDYIARRNMQTNDGPTEYIETQEAEPTDDNAAFFGWETMGAAGAPYTDENLEYFVFMYGAVDHTGEPIFFVGDPPLIQQNMALIVTVVAGSLSALCVIVAAVLYVANKSLKDED